MHLFKYQSSGWFSLLLALLMCAALLAPPGYTRAQSNGVFSVNVPIDLPDSNLADNICDADPGPAQKCTLRAAVMQANAMPGEQILDVVPMTYRLTIQGSGEDGARTGDLDITDALLVSIGQNDTPFTIDASGLGDRALDIFGTDTGQVKVQLLTMIVTGGHADRFGGGIRVGKNVNLRLSMSQVVGNSAGEAGGGIYSDGVLDLERTTVENNRTLAATGQSGGGGIYASQMIMEDSIIRANTSTSRGGGIFATSRVDIKKSAITGNSAQSDGGGVYYNGPHFYMRTSTVSGNHALVDIAQQIYSRGGGLNINVVYDFDISNSTIVNNTGFSGTHFNLESFGTLRHTIIANNALVNCSYQQNPFPGPKFNNLISDATCQLDPLKNIINTDPRLGPLTQVASNTPYHLPLPGSPVIDPALIAAGTSCLHETVDQRGWPRPVDGNGDGVARCDIGATERQPNDPTTTPIPSTPTPTPTPKPNATPTATPAPPIPPFPTAPTE